MTTRVERFLAHLDRVSGGIEPDFSQYASSNPGLKSVTVVSYADVPAPGHITAVTYGVSLAGHPEWTEGSAELVVAVASKDLGWVSALGVVAERLRGDCPFAYGDTINYGRPIAADTKMTAFVCFAPTVLKKEDYARIDVSPPGHDGHDLIWITGLYPVYQSEREFIHDQGLEAFWRREWDPWDVRREPVA